MIIKICGITTVSDALLCVEAGADAIGLNFCPRSPRFVSRVRAEEIIAQLHGRVLTVGVTIGRPEGDFPVCDVFQLHGIASESEILDLSPDRTWIAVAPERISDFRNRTVIVDTSEGTGQLANWDLLAGLDRPFVLAGGLSPENVADAIRRLNPSGVDVCSGVESSPGRKDPEKVTQFIGRARQAAQELSNPTQGWHQHEDQ